MRLVMALALMVPSAVMADDFVLTIPVSHAAVYQDGALVARETGFSAPAGDHRLIFPDLPERADAGTLTLRLGDQAITSLSFRDRYVPPRDGVDDPAVTAAEDRVETARQALDAQNDRVRRARIGAEAAQARVRFLAGIESGDGMEESDPARLMQIGEMIENGIRSASETALTAEIETRALEAALKPLREDLDAARAALAALRAPDGPGNSMIADITLAEAYDGPITLSYAVPNGANWGPLYDVMLTRGDTPALRMERGAYVQQNTGENWDKVALTLSSLSLYRSLSPNRPFPQRLRIGEPPAPAQLRSQSDSFAGAPQMEAPVMVQEAKASVLAGLGVVYSVPSPATIASGADLSRVGLDTLDLQVDALVAEAVPMHDPTAYLIAEVTNAGEEPILASDAARFHVDGVMVGQVWMDPIPAGGAATFGFGPIDGLQLTRTVLDRNEGDRGVISRTVEQSETVRIEVENVTGNAWDLRLFDRVPYSEQEDLTIEWRARPAPGDEAVDGQRGILRWDHRIAAGETFRVELDRQIRYPADQVLR